MFSRSVLVEHHDEVVLVDAVTGLVLVRVGLDLLKMALGNGQSATNRIRALLKKKLLIALPLLQQPFAQEKFLH